MNVGENLMAAEAIIIRSIYPFLGSQDHQPILVVQLFLPHSIPTTTTTTIIIIEEEEEEEDGTTMTTNVHTNVRVTNLNVDVVVEVVGIIEGSGTVEITITLVTTAVIIKVVVAAGVVVVVVTTEIIIIIIIIIITVVTVVTIEMEPIEIIAAAGTAIGITVEIEEEDRWKETLHAHHQKVVVQDILEVCLRHLYFALGKTKILVISARFRREKREHQAGVN